MNNFQVIRWIAMGVLVGVGCGDSNADGSLDVPATYAFDSRLDPGEGSVSYGGQVIRHVLMHDLNHFIQGLDTAIPASFNPQEQGDVVAALDTFFRFEDGISAATAHRVSTTPETLQDTYADISSGKDLVGKVAGSDDADHRDWSTELGGWSDPSIAQHGGNTTSPEGLIVAFFETLEELALTKAGGTDRLDPDGNVLPVYVTDDGLDLKQLIQKFLGGAVAFSQGTDKYLDDASPGTGLLSDNVEPHNGAPYTQLEHQWDEGFGYFGAARDYGDYTDDEIAGRAVGSGDVRPEYAGGYHDSDGDGAIDLHSEYNFGHSTNAAKRDRGSRPEAATDFTGDAWLAFRTGRAIIHAAVGSPLDDDQMAELRAQRDAAVLAWEKAIAATVVHYINDTLQEMHLIGTDDYSFADHAKVWSEMKGFALGLQFNPRSPLTRTEFLEVHALMGDAPVLEADGDEALEQYRQALVEARGIFRQAYDFDAANMGDDHGMGGW
jgi:hypothetical protein